MKCKSSKIIVKGNEVKCRVGKGGGETRLYGKSLHE